LNAVLHTFSERDRLFYKDTMAEIVRYSHDLNLHVYMNPWGLGNTFGGEALSTFVSRNPKAKQKSSEGVPLPAACLNHPDYREFLGAWIKDAVSTGTDAIFWDEPHWLTPAWRNERHKDQGWTCTCSYCRDIYESWYGQTMPDQLTSTVKEFRTRSILDLLGELTTSVASNEVENTICFVPGDGSEHGLSNWNELNSLEHVDTLATTPFWSLHNQDPENFVTEWSSNITTLAEQFGWKSQIWIQGFLLDGSSKTMLNHKQSIRSAIDSDPDSLFIWGWDGCRIMSTISCDRPMEVWNAFLQEIERYS